MCEGKLQSNDFIHHPAPESIYRRTDYLVNSNMAIPFALAGTWRYGVVSELARRKGLPQWDRRPEITAQGAERPTIPMGNMYGK